MVFQCLQQVLFHLSLQEAIEVLPTTHAHWWFQTHSTDTYTISYTISSTISYTITDTMCVCRQGWFLPWTEIRLTLSQGVNILLRHLLLSIILLRDLLKPEMQVLHSQSLETVTATLMLIGKWMRTNYVITKTNSFTSSAIRRRPKDPVPG